MAKLKNDCLDCPLEKYSCCPLREKADRMGLGGINRCEMRKAVENFKWNYKENLLKRYGGKKKSA